MKKSSFYWFCDECELNIKNHLNKQDRFAKFTGFKQTDKNKKQTSKDLNLDIIEIEKGDQNHSKGKDNKNKKVGEQPSTPTEVEVIEVPLKKQIEDQRKKTQDGEESKEKDKESREECREVDVNLEKYVNMNT